MVSAAIRILTLVEQTSYMGDGKSPFRGYGAIRAGSWLALKGLGPATATAKVGRAALVSNFDAEAMRGGADGWWFSHSLYTGRPHTRAATRPLAPPSSLKTPYHRLNAIV